MLEDFGPATRLLLRAAARGDVLVHQHDFAQDARLVNHREREGAHPTRGLGARRRVGQGLFRVVEDRGQLGGLAREDFAEDGRDALLFELRVFEDVVVAELFERNAPEAFPSAVDPDRAAVRRENLRAHGRLLEGRAEQLFAAPHAEGFSMFEFLSHVLSI